MLSSINDLWENQTNIKGLKKFAFSRSKSRVPWGRVGSIPTAGTKYINPFGIGAFREYSKIKPFKTSYPSNPCPSID